MKKFWRGSSYSVLGRVGAFLTLVLFCFQLFRVFLVVPTDSYICTEEENLEHSAVQSHHDDNFLPPTDGAGQGMAIQHCKDNLNGIGLIATVAYMQPPSPSIQPPPSVWTKVSREPGVVIARNVPPPFQPPRFV